MGRGYVETKSTVGIHEEMCDVDLSYASIGGGQWSEYKPPIKQLEHALASMMHQPVNDTGSVSSPGVSITSVVADMHKSDTMDTTDPEEAKDIICPSKSLTDVQVH